VTGSVPVLRLWIHDIDRHRTLTWLAAAGLAVGVALAVFGLPPLDLHSPVHHLGVMDPLCGMTRGTRLTLRGDYGRAIEYNPAAPLVPLGGLALVLRGLFGRITGRWPDLSVRWTPPLIAVAAVVVALLWVRQQANAALLTDGGP
jgi:hypothetical protein